MGSGRRRHERVVDRTAGDAEPSKLRGEFPGHVLGEEPARGKVLCEQAMRSGRSASGRRWESGEYGEGFERGMAGEPKVTICDGSYHADVVFVVGDDESYSDTGIDQEVRSSSGRHR
jgi:hypothetical protein